MLSDMANIASELQSEYEAMKERAENIFSKIRDIKEVMLEDIDAAEEVLKHNEHVLEQYQEQLDNLEAKSESVASQLHNASETYRQAAEDETYVRNTSYTEETKHIHAEAVNIAHHSVMEAEYRCNQLKMEQSSLNRKVSCTNQNMAEVERAIEELNRIIEEIRGRYDRAERYRERLESAVIYMDNAASQFSFVYDKSKERLVDCRERAEQAVAYGDVICSLLDPDGSVSNHENCLICFSDVYALDHVAADFMGSCEQYEDAADIMRDNISMYGHIMQDAVMTEGTNMMNSVRTACSEEIDLIRQTARNCKEAGINLKNYANL